MLSAVHSKSGGGGWRVNMHVKLRLTRPNAQAFFQPFPAENIVTRNPVGIRLARRTSLLFEAHRLLERLRIIERTDK